MFDAAPLRELINEHGVVVTLRKRSNGSYNVTTGKVVQSNTDYTVKVYFFNNDPSVGEYSNIVRAERRAVIADILVNGSVTPDVDVSDEIIYGGFTTTVTRASKITSSTPNMCQMVYLRD